MKIVMIFTLLILSGCTAIYLKAGDTSPVQIEVHENTAITENR